MTSKATKPNSSSTAADNENDNTEMASASGSEATRVMLVDDSSVVRLMMRIALEADGFQIFDLPSAHNIERHAEEFKPQVIVCDLLMPGRDGLSVFRALQESDNTRHIPVILATAK